MNAIDRRPLLAIWRCATSFSSLAILGCFMLLAKSSSLSQTVPDEELKALIALYEATDGPNWVDSEEWIVNPDVSTWSGIVLGPSGRVKNIVLPNNRLEGRLPAEFARFKNLQVLNLQGNPNLEVPLDSTLIALSGLRVLILSDTNIEAKLPPEFSFPDLLQLRMAGSGILGPLPEAFFKMTSINNLNLSRNPSLDLSSLGQFEAFTELIDLALTSTPINGPWPESLSFPKLEHLRLSSTGLSGSTPEWIFNTATLKTIEIGNNANLEPPAIGDFDALPDLSVLNLSLLPLNASLPDPFNFPNLTSLQLSKTGLSGPIPPSFFESTKLKLLNLGNNPDLVLPSLERFGEFLELETLLLFGVPASGPFPASWRQLENMTTISLNFVGGMTGSIPEWIGEWIKLKNFYITGSGLAGPIPEALFGMDGLTQLYLGDMEIESLPDGLADLTDLFRLRVHGNRLTELPDLTGLDKLTMLWVKDNRLHFDDLEPYLAIDEFIYGTEMTIDVPQDRIEALLGTTVRVQVPVGGSSNRYQWFRVDENANLIEVAGQTTDELVIAQVTGSSTGVYHLHVTSGIVPDLTLVSEPITIAVEALPATADVNVTFDFTADKSEFKSSDWHLISLPGAANRGVDSYIQRSATSDDWYAYIDTGADGLKEDFFVPFNQSDSRFKLTAGHGMWVTGVEGIRFNANETAPAAPLTDGAYRIPLQAGWNIIGNPFDWAVSLESIRQANDESEDLVVFGWNAEVGRFFQASSLEPGQGYYYENTDGRDGLVTPYPGNRILPTVEPLVYQDRVDVVLEDQDGTEIQRVSIVQGADGRTLGLPPTVAGPELALYPTDATGRYGRKTQASVAGLESVEEISIVASNPASLGYRIRIESFGQFADQGWRLLSLAEGLDVGEDEFLPLAPLNNRTLELRVISAQAPRSQLRPPVTELWPSYPNPVQAHATLPYSLSKTSDVRLALYTLDGRRVATLDAGDRAAGRHEIELDTGALGLSSGIYVVRLIASGVSKSRKLVVVR